jgi:membrane protease YdiL (CAAX protease family)
VLAAGGLYIGLLFVFVSLSDGDVFARAEADPWTFLWTQCLDDSVLAGVALLFARLTFPGSWPGLGFRAVSPRWLAVGAGAGVGAAIMAWAVSAVLEAGGLAIPSHPVETLLGRVSGVPDLLLVLLGVTVPVAFGEETFFRGLAYRVVRARWGVPLAVTVTALAFALVHGYELGGWLPVLPVGLVLAALVEWSGSLLPAMVAHAVVNALAVLID